jgi:hypothetical protein
LTAEVIRTFGGFKVATTQLIKNLINTRARAYDQARHLADRCEKKGKPWTSADQAEFDRYGDEIDELTDRIRELEGLDAQERDHAGQRRPFENVVRGRHGDPDPNDVHPLSFTAASLDAIQELVDTRTAGMYKARLEERAALATGTYGAPRGWGANVLLGPRLLHRAAGVPQQLDLGAVSAQFPQLTLPGALAGTAENVALAEYASSTAGTVTLSRYGRWTDISTEAELSTSVSALLAIHQVGIAKDLDKLLIDAVEAAAGAAVAFTTDVPAAIRKSIATVIDNTAASGPEDLVILTNPADTNLLQSVTPTGGITIAERFQNFSGALVYPSSATDAGFMTVANLRAGARYFEARGLTVQTFTDPKTGTMTNASSVIAGYGLGLVGGATGFAQKVDVVTP